MHESQPMVRGHAEALMPLIARVMERAGLDFAALDRIAVTTGPGSFTGLRVGIAAARGIALAAGKPAVGLTTLAAFAAPLDRRRRHAAGGRGDRCAPRSRLSAGVRTGRPHLGGAAARALARGAARRGDRRAAPHRHRGGDAGGGLAGRRTRAEPGRCSAARPTSTGWRGSAPPRPRPAHRRSRFTCARPTPSRKTPRNWRADDRLFCQTCSRAASRRCRKRRAATPRAIAALHAASFRRGWSEQEVEGLLTDRHVIAHRAMTGRPACRLHHVAAGRRRGGNPLGRGRRAPARPRPGAQSAQSASAPAGRPWARARCFWRSTSTTTAAIRLYDRAGFHEVSRRPNYYPGPGGKAVAALVLRRDLV